MKNHNPKQQAWIDQYFEELHQLQAMQSQYETTRLFQELEKKIVLKLIECINAISFDDKNAAGTLLKLSKGMLLLRKFKG